MATFKFTARPGHAVYLGKSLGGRAVFNQSGEFVTEKEAVAAILRRSKYTEEMKASKEESPTPTPAPALAKPAAPAAPEAPDPNEAPASTEAPVASSTSNVPAAPQKPKK